MTRIAHFIVITLLTLCISPPCQAQPGEVEFHKQFRVSGIYMLEEDRGFIIIEDRATGEQETYQVGSAVGEFTILKVDGIALRLRDRQDTEFVVKIQNGEVQPSRSAILDARNPGRSALDAGLLEFSQLHLFKFSGFVDGAVNIDGGIDKLEDQLRNEFFELLLPILQYWEELDWSAFMTDGKLDMDKLLADLARLEEGFKDENALMVTVVRGMLELQRGNNEVAAQLLERAITGQSGLRNLATQFSESMIGGLHYMLSLPGIKHRDTEEALAEILKLTPSDLNRDYYLNSFLNSTVRRLTRPSLPPASQENMSLYERMLKAHRHVINPDEHRELFTHGAVWMSYLNSREHLVVGEPEKASPTEYEKHIGLLRIASALYARNSAFPLLLGCLEINSGDVERGLATWRDIRLGDVHSFYEVEMIEMHARMDEDSGKSYLMGACSLGLPQMPLLRKAINKVTERAEATAVKNPVAAIELYDQIGRITRLQVNKARVYLVKIKSILYDLNRSEAALSLAEEKQLTDYLPRLRNEYALSLRDLLIRLHSISCDALLDVGLAEITMDFKSLESHMADIWECGLDEDLIQRSLPLYETYVAGGPDQFPLGADLDQENYVAAREFYQSGDLGSAAAELRKMGDAMKQHFWATQLLIDIYGLPE